MSLSDDLNRFVVKAGVDIDRVVADVVTELATRIDQRSPVGDPSFWSFPAPAGYTGGLFRGNWQLGVDKRPQGVLARIDKTGDLALPANIALIPTDAAGHIYYLANNVHYAMKIEDGVASPRQAPHGVVGRTAIEFRQIASAAVEKRS